MVAGCFDRADLGRRLDLRELWSCAGWASCVALRDLQLRYRQTLFGVAWAVLSRQLESSSRSCRQVRRSAKRWPSLSTLRRFGDGGLVAFVCQLELAAAESVGRRTSLITEAGSRAFLAPTAAVLALIIDLLVRDCARDPVSNRLRRDAPCTGAYPATLAGRGGRMLAIATGPGWPQPTFFTGTSATRSASFFRHGSSSARSSIQLRWSKADGAMSSR